MRVTAFGRERDPLKKGNHLYSVFAAVGYGPGNHRGQLWHVAAFAGESEREFREFFRQLGGQPEVVVCHGSCAIRNAAAWAFPKAEVNPCAWHLYNGLRQHIRRAGLHNSRRRIFQVLREDMFWHPARWDHFERVFARYRNADLSQADPKVAAGIADIVKWRRPQSPSHQPALTADTPAARPQAPGGAARHHPGPPCRPPPRFPQLHPQADDDESRGEASVRMGARPARKPPPPRGQAAAASPARRRGAHRASGAADGRGALRAERYVARAVSQPRFAQTSSVAAALFIV